MRVFVTGASGWIGSAVVLELLAGGHQVIGLARSDDAAAVVEGLGAEVLRGSLDDLGVLRKGAEAADGVVHLGFNHDFTDFMGAIETDQRAIEALGTGLEGRGGPFLIASGTLGLSQGQPATEDDKPDTSWGRGASAELALSFGDRGVKPVIVRLPPTVHGDGDHGFVATLVSIARERGSSAYIGEGSNHWSAVHRFDAARLIALAVDRPEVARVVHVVADQGIETRAIAEIIGRKLDLPVASVDPDASADHFGWMALMFSMEGLASSDQTRARFDWQPTHPNLVDDLEAGYYFR